MKACIKRPDGTTIDVEGTPEEIQKLLALPVERVVERHVPCLLPHYFQPCLLPHYPCTRPHYWDWGWGTWETGRPWYLHAGQQQFMPSLTGNVETVASQAVNVPSFSVGPINSETPNPGATATACWPALTVTQLSRRPPGTGSAS
jgi:hypothetical protein